MGIGEAEAFSERLKRELQALGAANVHEMFMRGLFKVERNLVSFGCWQHRLSVLFGIYLPMAASYSPEYGSLVKKLLVFLNFAYMLLVLNYSYVGSMVLSLRETLAAYGSVHYIGTIIPIVLILLSHVIKPAKPGSVPDLNGFYGFFTCMLSIWFIYFF